MEEITLQKKICLLGLYGVGKTSLIQRFVYNRFDDLYLTTIGVKVSQKILPSLQNSEGKNIRHNFLIWDIEGGEKNHFPVRNYLTGAAGAIFVADLTRLDTIEELVKLVEGFHSVCPERVAVFAGNKLDLGSPDSDAVHKLEKIAGSFKSHFFLTSARTGEKVEDLFFSLSHSLAG